MIRAYFTRQPTIVPAVNAAGERIGPARESRPEPVCSHCGGSGKSHGELWAAENPCLTCGGSGRATANPEGGAS